MEKHTVLIVGAGPTGLLMACELARFGITFRIIDKKANPTQTTNAAGIHVRTLEILEHIGIADKFVNAGWKTEYLQMYNNKNRLAKIPLNTVDSLYKYILMLPQSETEKFLNDHLTSLGGHVERNVELISLVQENNKVISTLKLISGETETIESDWVIGCDGYRSTVREQSKIKMTGEDLEQGFLVADVRIKTEYDRNAVNMFLNKGMLLGLFPLRNDTNDLYRIVANSNQVERKEKYSEEEIKTIINKHTQGECEVTEIIWSSPFWIHSKLAERLQNESVLIAGDAAHVHSPAGAQGMNTGLQDVFNLAWKLALVIKGNASRDILASYQSERYPIMKQLVFITEKLAILGLTNNSLLLGIRNFFFKNVADKVKFLNQKVVNRVTQISLKYKHSSLIDFDKKGHFKGPQPGERTPDVTLKNNVRFYDSIRNNQHNLLLFTGPSPTPKTIAIVFDAYDKIASNWGHLIMPHIVSNQKIDRPNVIDDKDLAIHDRYHVTKPSMCLIRPDQYIGLFTGEIDAATLESFLTKAGFFPKNQLAPKRL